MAKHVKTLALAAVLAAGVALPAMAAEGGASKPAEDCFFLSQFDNWKAADENTVYLHVRPDRYYKLEMATACHKITGPGAQLTLRPRGKQVICRALDWDLRVSWINDDAPEQCIVKSMTPMTPDEVSALPAKVKP